MVTNISNSPGETFLVGAALGREARTGWVIGLTGDLGAGKTQLVKGIAHGLGYDGRVTSPSFTLVNVYEGGRLPLYHLDLYRLSTTGEILGAGLDEYLDPEGVAVIEWMERWEGPPPTLGRRLRIEILGENERRIHYENFGN